MKAIETKVKIKSNVDDFKKLIDGLEESIQKVNDFVLEFEVVHEE